MAKNSADKPPKAKGRKTAPIQVEVQLARWVAIIATHDGITQSELLSPIIKEPITHAYKRVQKEMGKEIEGLS